VNAPEIIGGYKYRLLDSTIYRAAYNIALPGNRFTYAT